jgi:hypothetical protein
MPRACPAHAFGEMRRIMNQTQRRCGRFTLIHSFQGFAWELTTRAGNHWFWHPTEQQWSGRCQWFPTDESASAGLDWTLAHERAGDLNRQHLAPKHGPVLPASDKDKGGV